MPTLLNHYSRSGETTSGGSVQPNPEPTQDSPSRDIGPGPWITLALVIVGVVIIAALWYIIERRHKRRRENMKPPTVVDTTSVNGGDDTRGDADDISFATFRSSQVDSLAHLQNPFDLQTSEVDDDAQLKSYPHRLVTRLKRSSKVDTAMISPPLTPPSGSILGSWDNYVRRGVAIERYNSLMPPLTPLSPASKVHLSPLKSDRRRSRPRRTLSMRSSKLTISTFGFSTPMPASTLLPNSPKLPIGQAI